jgi:hypothetical protein
LVFDFYYVRHAIGSPQLNPPALFGTKEQITVE